MPDKGPAALGLSRALTGAPRLMRFRDDQAWELGYLWRPLGIEKTASRAASSPVTHSLTYLPAHTLEQLVPAVSLGLGTVTRVSALCRLPLQLGPAPKSESGGLTQRPPVHMAKGSPFRGPRASAAHLVLLHLPHLRASRVGDQTRHPERQRQGTAVRVSVPRTGLEAPAAGGNGGFSTK